MFYEFNGHRPVVHSSSFVHPQAAVTGDVIIGKDVYIGPGAAIRGDWGRIIIEDGCNVQENCTIHMFPGVTVLLREGAHIGHGAIVHGATIGRNCLIGMNAVIMDNAEIGDECIVGAQSLVKSGEIIPPRYVVAGSPAKIIKIVSDEMLQWKSEGTAIYRALPGEMGAGWKPCEPLRPEDAADRGSAPADQSKHYKTWDEIRQENGSEDNQVNEPAEAYGEERKFSVREYLMMEEHSEWKHEYYKGEVTAMSSPGVDHVRITRNLLASIVGKLTDSGCEVFGEKLRICVESEEFFCYPDASIVCGKLIPREDDGWNVTNPVVLFEVLSPSTAKYDRTEKFERYMSLTSFREYILIDSRSVLVEQFIKDDQGNWNSTKYRQLTDTLALAAVGISMTLEEIYRQTSFPKLTL